MSTILDLFLGHGPAKRILLPSSFLTEFDVYQYLPDIAECILLQTRGGSSAALGPFLQGCRRVLGGHGRIGVVVENRLYWLLAMLRSGKLPQRSIGPSLGTILRSLRRAQFRNLTVYSITPSSGEPQEIRPRSGVLDWPPASYLVTADAGKAADISPIDRMLASMNRSLNGSSSSSYRLTRIVNSDKEKSIAFVTDGCSQYVLRIPYSEVAQDVETKAYALLESLKTNSRLENLVPHPVVRGEASDYSFFVESQVSGVPLATKLNMSNRASYVRKIDQLLRTMNDLPRGTLPAVETADTMLASSRLIIERVLNCVDASLRQSAWNMVSASLQGATSRVGLIHGDLSVSNIFVTEDTISGVIDWENARHPAPVVLDAFNYLDSAQRHCRKDFTLVDTISLLADGEWPVSAEFDFLQAYFQYAQTDFRFRRGFALLYFIHHVGPQLRFVHAADAVRKRTTGVLERLVKA